MGGAGFDALARAVGRRGSRRAAFGAAAAWAATLARGGPAAAATFDRNCSQFQIAARDRKKFEHVDDNLLIEVQAKGSRRWKSVWDDRTDDNVNYKGDPFRVKPFRAKVGDKIRIRAYNLEGQCDLDEVWLFCADGRGTGKKLLNRYGPKSSCPAAQFVDETVRIKP